MEPEDRIADEDIRDILDELEDAAEGETEEMEGPKPLEDDEIESIFSVAVQDAIDFIESDVSEDRIKAQRYFDGECDLGYEDGRSRVVSTKVRDTVRAVKPSLMRVFLSSSKFVEYIPRGPEDVLLADQATTYMHWKFQEMGGYRILSDAFHDALIKKMGVVKAYYEEKKSTKVYTFTGLNDMQFNAIMADPDIQILEHSETTEASMAQTPDMVMAQPPMVSHDVKVARTTYAGDLCVDSIPPEEFFFDRNARSISDCYVCGQRTDMRVGDLVAMGFEFDDVVDLDSSTDTDTIVAQEEEARRGYSMNPNDDENATDPSMKKVMVTEAYMRIDADGQGVGTLHRAILGGSKYKLLMVEPCDEIPYAIFEVDPEPHTMLGRSLADITMDDQDATTAMLRGILDNVAMVNNPRLAVVEGQASIEDILNNEVGAIIRQRAPGMVQTYEIPFTAGQTMGALQYMDSLVEQKTGVTRASAGLDPDALQSTTKAAVVATMQAAAGQVEVMARNLAEGGMRQLFGLLLRLTVKHADGEKMMRLNGMFQPVDPRVWDTSMDLIVNVGVGTGREEEKAMAYREVLGLQMQIFQAYGPTNGVVSLTGIRNTLSDMMATAGIRNSERYFNPMNQQIEQQLMAAAQQAAQAQQGQQADPNAAYLQAEQMKAQVKMQSDAQRAQLDMQKAQADHGRKLEQMRVDQDLQRDKMAQDLALSNAELLAKYGIKANEMMIKAEQSAVRDQNGVIR
jgi:hypothetical protein